MLKHNKPLLIALDLTDSRVSVVVKCKRNVLTIYICLMI